MVLHLQRNIWAVTEENDTQLKENVCPFIEKILIYDYAMQTHV